MKSSGLLPTACAAVLLTVSCASSAPTVDPESSLRVVGTENDVRIDAQILSNSIGPSSLVTFVYEIRNLREDPIIFAEVDPSVEYVPSTATFTVGLGAEIPLDGALTKMTRIESGESRVFKVAARVAIPPAAARFARPRFLQVRLNYLDFVEPFEPYIEAPAAADEILFASWISHMAAIVTNALPIRWGATPIVSAAERLGPQFR